MHGEDQPSIIYSNTITTASLAAPIRGNAGLVSKRLQAKALTWSPRRRLGRSRVSGLAQGSDVGCRLRDYAFASGLIHGAGSRKERGGERQRMKGGEGGGKEEDQDDISRATGPFLCTGLEQG